MVISSDRRADASLLFLIRSDWRSAVSPLLSTAEERRLNGNWMFRPFVSLAPGRFAIKTFRPQAYSMFPAHLVKPKHQGLKRPEVNGPRGETSINRLNRPKLLSTNTNPNLIC